MQLDKIVTWYQKKISTYDKQQWEKTVEQRILNGFVHVPLRNTELKTELIDVDLVRGSSFPKAKPKQSLLTVLKLSVLRFLLLPIYARWWVEQTSPRIFSTLLLLYLMQMFNCAVYSYNAHRLDDSEHIVSMIEFVIPMSLSLILSIIHSQIVATASIKTGPNGRNPFWHSKKKKRERIRRKRKHNQLRPTSELKIPLIGDHNNDPLGTVYLRQPTSITTTTTSTTVHQVVDQISCSTPVTIKTVGATSKEISTYDKTKSDVILNKTLGLGEGGGGGAGQRVGGPSNRNELAAGGLRKRFVNFKMASTEERAATTVARLPQLAAAAAAAAAVHEDDGFESLNGKSSSGEDTTAAARGRRLVGDDDGGANLPVCDEELKVDMTEMRRNIVADDTSEECAVESATTAITSASGDPIPSYPSSSSLRATQQQQQQRKMLSSKRIVDSTDTDEDGADDDAETIISSPNVSGVGNLSGSMLTTECTTSATEWMVITTNSEDCSYSSELDHSDSQYSEDGGEHDFTPTVILNPCCGNSDRISCTIWDRRQTKKAELSVLDISTSIIERVEAMPETCDYIYIGCALSIFLSLVPVFCRLCEATITLTNSTDINILSMPMILMENTTVSNMNIVRFAFGTSTWEQVVLITSFVLRICLTFLFFFLLAVAERTFKQRFLYAKLFSHLTSSRRARKSKVPHFRLNKVRNIKIWLSVRSYLKRRGPQRSVDVIVSAAFLLALFFLGFLSVEWLKDSVHLHSQYNLEALIWSCCLGCFLLRFMTLGNKINRKYRNISVLITEQINLYLQIEQKPQKKEELMVANSVLKLAADLLKELESPFKISGLSANPYLYTTIKVVILSALSGVLSEMLGFKLKLHKIKIK